MPKVNISQQTLAEEMNISVDRIQAWLKELYDEGWIEVIRRGKKLTSIYVLHPISGRLWKDWLLLKKADLKIRSDHELARRLRDSLYHK